MHPQPAGKWTREDLHAMWKTAKSQSEAKAKPKKEEAQALAKLQKDKLNEKLGDSLEAWPKLYPNIPKLAEAKNKLDAKLKKYFDAIKASQLSEDVQKPMRKAIADIKTKLDVQLDDAKLVVLGADLKAVKNLGAPQMTGLGPGKKLGTKQEI
jgi:hypothetical protein